MTTRDKILTAVVTLLLMVLGWAALGVASFFILVLFGGR